MTMAAQIPLGELVQNICLYALVVLAYASIRRGPVSSWTANLAKGLVFGIGAIVAMSMNIPVAPGVFVDGRSIMTVLAAVFGGPVGGVTAAVMVGAYRLWLGGIGAEPAVLGIAASCVAGLIFRWRFDRNRRRHALLAFWALGAVVVTLNLASILILSEAQHLIAAIALPMYLAIPAGTAVVGWLLAREDRLLLLQREHAEQAELLEAIVHSMSDGVAVANAKGEIVLANPAATRLAGATSPTVPADRWADAYGVYRPDGSGLYPAEEMPLLRAVRGEATNDVEMLVQNPADGRRRLLSVSGRPLVDANGVSRGGVVVFHDITEQAAMQDALRASEQRLRDAIDSINEGFVLFDRDMRIVSFNRHILDLYPVSASVIRVGAHLEEVLRYGAAHGEYSGVETPEQVDAFVRSWMDRLSGPEPVRLERAFAGGRWILISHHRTSDGGYVGTRTDITELRQREEELRKTHAALEQQAAKLNALAESLAEEKRRADQVSREKSQFLANISHELRTPLNAILGFSEVIRLGLFGPLTPPRYLDYVEMIHTSGEHLLSLINDILDIAKIEAGKMDLKVIPLSASRLAGECFELVSGLSRGAGLELRRSCAEDDVLFGDARVVKQIIVNLLSNAIKSTPPGGTVELSIRRVEGGVDVAVTDSGVGMDPSQVEKALRPFEQVTGGYVREMEGTGLGLPLSKSLAELHGGSLRIVSRPGAGTTVTVHLPDRRELEATDPVARMA